MCPSSTRAMPIVWWGARRRSVGLPGIEDLETPAPAAGRPLVMGKVRMAVDHGVDAGEAPPHPRQPPRGRPGVVDHGDPRPVGLDDPRLGQPPAQLAVVDVAAHGRDRPERLDRQQHRQRAEVTGVEDEIGLLEPLHAGVGERPRTPGQMGVGDDRQQHQGC